MLRAGAVGYLSKRDSIEDLVNAVAWAQGNAEKFVGRRMTHHLWHQFLDGAQRPELQAVDSLSDRELEVFRLAGTGRGTAAMARGLNMSVKTVETHYARIKRKLGLRSVEELKRHAAAWVAVGRGRRLVTGQSAARSA